MKKKLPLFLILAFAVTGWALVTYLYLKYEMTGEYYGKVYDGQAPDFKLVDQDGHPTSLNEFRDKVVLIEWGYTNCPDVCPITLSKLNKAMEALGDKSSNVHPFYNRRP